MFRATPDPSRRMSTGGKKISQDFSSALARPVAWPLLRSGRGGRRTMRSGWRWVGFAAVVCAVAVSGACGEGAGGVTTSDGGIHSGDAGGAGGGAGPLDAGGAGAGAGDAGDSIDAGAVDAGVPDAGAGDAGRADGGAPDASVDAGVTIVPPNLGPDWTFYATAEGLPPNNVMGVTADDDGTLYVAGGDAGLFVLRGGQTAFQRYGIADGLHPYGYPRGA